MTSISLGPLAWESAVRSVVMAIALTSALTACSGALTQLSPAGAAQSNYDKALADYQNCYSANRSVEACDKERQMLDASTKMLARTLAGSR